LTLTYPKEINDVTNNDKVLEICGAVAEKLQVPYDRITDAYGGFFENAATDLPPPPKKANTTNSTNKSNATRLLANVTEYPINIYS